MPPKQRVEVHARDGEVREFAMKLDGYLGRPGMNFLQTHGGPARGSDVIPPGHRLHCSPNGCAWGKR
jgi:hypothetical protein